MHLQRGYIILAFEHKANNELFQVLTWLEENARQVVTRVDANDPLIADCKAKYVCMHWILTRITLTNPELSYYIGGRGDTWVLLGTFTGT